jgi:hypothetical protein
VSPVVFHNKLRIYSPGMLHIENKLTGKTIENYATIIEEPMSEYISSSTSQNVSSSLSSESVYKRIIKNSKTSTLVRRENFNLSFIVAKPMGKSILS